MRKRRTLLACLLGLGLLSPAFTKPITPAPETKDKDANDVSTRRIEQLVKQLGSTDSADREKAQKELEAIGTPALEMLRRAVKDGDPEVSLRASQVVSRLDEKNLTVSILSPKKVKLSLKNVSVVQAVEELSKLSGYAIQIEGDRTPLANRKISLETGDVTFFEALDQLCLKGGLVEKLQTGPSPRPGPGVGPIIRPGVKIQPVPIQPLPMQPGQQPQAAPVPRGLQPAPQLPFGPNGAIDPEPFQKAIEEQIKNLQQGVLAPQDPAEIVNMMKAMEAQVKAMEAQMQAQMQLMQAQIQIQQGGQGGGGAVAGAAG
jgi:hypothetical protein